MQMSDSTKKSFLEFQQETIFIPNVTDCDRRSVSIEPTVARSWDDGNEVVGVQDKEKTSSSG